ncbi:MAG TPA: protein-export chaperone SecB [Spirochaetota bacterium]|nr:protein-export chaperone SecB [Spirochaetota bacterium]HPP49604.1 protein-export chaperone SecB [Spirochaetota bacterium]
MDKDKQPGIKIDAILLVESFFKRTPNVSLPIPLNIKFSINNTIDKEKKQLVTEMKVMLNSEKDSVYAYVVYVGIFSTADDENMSLEDFAEKIAPAHIYPYIREEIHIRSIKAGLPPIIIQPLNFMAKSVKKQN